MNFSLCRFLDTLPPIAVSREGDQSACGRAGSLWVSLLNARELQTFSKTAERSSPFRLKQQDYAKAFALQQGGQFANPRQHR